jgi:DNA-binding IclR family transcriptional regulator
LTSGGGAETPRVQRSYLARSNLATEFRRADAELGLLADDTIVLSVLDQREVTYVDTRHGKRPVATRSACACRRTARRAGSCCSPHSARSGRRAVCGQLVRDAHPAQPVGPSELAAELERVRARSYTIDDEETALGMVGVGAPCSTAPAARRAR